MLIVTAPLWFKAPFKILRLFVREKLRERVFTVSVPQLALHVSRTALPIHLGGTLEIKHATWLLSCRQSMTNREDELANIVGVGVGSESGSAVAAVANGTSETTAAATATAGSTIISAVHQLGENNTTVVTVVSNGDDPAVSGGGGGSEPNENITINGLSPSHQRQANGSSSSSSASTAVNPLKLNTSGLAESGSCSTTNAAATATAGEELPPERAQYQQPAAEPQPMAAMVNFGQRIRPAAPRPASVMTIVWPVRRATPSPLNRSCRW